MKKMMFKGILLIFILGLAACSQEEPSSATESTGDSGIVVTKMIEVTEPDGSFIGYFGGMGGEGRAELTIINSKGYVFYIDENTGKIYEPAMACAYKKGDAPIAGCYESYFTIHNTNDCSDVDQTISGNIYSDPEDSPSSRYIYQISGTLKRYDHENATTFIAYKDGSDNCRQVNGSIYPIITTTTAETGVKTSYSTPFRFFYEGQELKP
jgi:hypothetical protein